MTVSGQRVLISFCVVAIIFSCKHNPVVKGPGQANKAEIDNLITLGRKYQNSHVDSLLSVARKLSAVAKLTGNKRSLVYSELFTAQYFWLSGNHKTSMETAVKCLADAEKWNIKPAYPIIYGLIGNLHKENSNYQLAFDAQQKGLNWAKANRDTNYIIFLLGLKAMFVHSLKQTVNSSAKSDSSINLYMAALKVAESGKKLEPLRISLYDNIAQYYFENDKEYKKAIYYGKKGINLALKYKRQRALTYGYTWVGKAYFFKGEKRTGLNYLNKALLTARSIKEPYREMQIYDDLSECYYLSGNYKQAFKLNKVVWKMGDSMQVNINEKQISELQIKYETIKKDKTLLLLDHDTKVKNIQLIVVLGGSLLGIIFSTILILQYRVIRRSHRLIEVSNLKKDKALENIAFIQAHELRRPLASIMGIINVIKAMEYEFDPECLLKLEKAGEELDEKIHSVLAHVEKEGS